MSHLIHLSNGICFNIKVSDFFHEFSKLKNVNNTIYLNENIFKRIYLNEKKKEDTGIGRGGGKERNRIH